MIVLTGDREKVEWVRFSPDGRALIASSARGVRVYADLRDGATPTAYVEHQAYFPARFTPDGGGIIRYVSNGPSVWDLAAEREEALPIPGPFDLSPDALSVVCSTRCSAGRSETLSRSTLTAPPVRLWAVE